MLYVLKQSAVKGRRKQGTARTLQAEKMALGLRIQR